MAIQGISGLPNSALLSGVTQNPSSTKTGKAEDTAASKLGSLQDSVESSSDLLSVALSVVTGKDTSSQMGRFTDLTNSLLSQQAKTLGSGLSTYYNASGNQVTMSSSYQMISFDMTVEFDESDLAAMQNAAKGAQTDSTQAADAAADAAADDGYWGVNAVADRIMDMAAALAGDDTDMIETLRDAVAKGFEKTYSQLGGEEFAPPVTQATQEEIFARFDYWAENGTLDGYVPGE